MKSISRIILFDLNKMDDLFQLFSLNNNLYLKLSKMFQTKQALK